ncbi:hypothetical protein HETIRDRAFT_311549, partial [Heterobasidion irregulare TC 32-1]
QIMCCLEVFQVFMVCLDLEGMSCSFEVVVPIFQSFYDGQKFMVMDVIILFSWGE